MKSQAFRAGWIDYHLGISGAPHDRTYARAPLISSWQAGWRRAAEEQDSRHWEKQGNLYVYVQVPRDPLVADQPIVSRAWAR